MKLKPLKKILNMTQKELKKYLESRLRSYGYNVSKGDGWLYKAGTFPILLVAHMDTVHKRKPGRIVINGDVWSSPNGIGGDDRCGVFMIMEIIKKYDCHVLFVEDEEIGCIGSGKFTDTDLCQSLKGKFKYLIELDRRGKNDAVFYDLDNIEFENFITEKYWKTEIGSCSDICYLAPELDCAAVNLSCGYYNEHHLDETINVAEMERNIREVELLLARSDNIEKFDWKEIEWKSKWNYKYDYDWGYYSGGNYNLREYDWEVMWIDEEGNEAVDVVFAETEEEATGIFMMEHPYVCYANVLYVQNSTYAEWVMNGGK